MAVNNQDLGAGPMDFKNNDCFVRGHQADGYGLMKVSCRLKLLASPGMGKPQTDWVFIHLLDES